MGDPRRVDPRTAGCLAVAALLVIVWAAVATAVWVAWEALR